MQWKYSEYMYLKQHAQMSVCDVPFAMSVCVSDNDVQYLVSACVSVCDVPYLGSARVGDSDVLHLVSACVSDRKDMDTTRLKSQFVKVATDVPVLRAHSG